MRIAVSFRKRPFAAAILLVLAAGFAAAQAAGLPPAEAGAKDRLNSSPRHGEWARFPAPGGDAVDAWVVYPERVDKAPVVLVVHEIFGLSDWVRSVADQFAAEGFIAVAPDFLSGKAPGGKGSAGLERDAATALIRTLDPAEVVRRLDAAAAYASSLPAASGRVGVVGYCWGGAVSFSYATQSPALGAAVVFYGTSPATAALSAVEAPVLGLYGGNDNRVNATVPAAAEEMKRLGKRFEAEFYAGAGHGFLRQQDGQNGANMEAAKQAWVRAVAFLKTELEISAQASADAQALLAAFANIGDCVDECAADADGSTLSVAAALTAAR